MCSAPSSQGRQFVAENLVTRMVEGPVISHLPSLSCITGVSVCSSAQPAKNKIQPYLCCRRFERFIKAYDLAVAFLAEGQVEFPLLDAEDVRVDTIDGVNQGSVRASPNHGDKRTDVHTLMWNSKEYNSIHGSKKLQVVVFFRFRQSDHGLACVLEILSLGIRPCTHLFNNQPSQAVSD